MVVAVNSTSLTDMEYKSQFLCVYLQGSITFKVQIEKHFLILSTLCIQHERTQQSGVTRVCSPGMNCSPTVHMALRRGVPRQAWFPNTEQLRLQVHSMLMPASTFWKQALPCRDHFHTSCQMQRNKALSMEVLICFKYTAKSQKCLPASN